MFHFDVNFLKEVTKVVMVEAVMEVMVAMVMQDVMEADMTMEVHMVVKGGYGCYGLIG